MPPIPYAEPGNTYSPPSSPQYGVLGMARATAALVASRTNQVAIAANRNSGAITLTGTDQVIAEVGPLSLTATQKIVVSGSIAATNLSPGTDSELVMSLVDSVEGTLVGPVYQFIPAAADGASASFELEYAGTLAAHTISLQAHAAGDGTAGVNVRQGSIVVAVYGT